MSAHLLRAAANLADEAAQLLRAPTIDPDRAANFAHHLERLAANCREETPAELCAHCDRQPAAVTHAGRAYCLACYQGDSLEAETLAPAAADQQEAALRHALDALLAAFPHAPRIRDILQPAIDEARTALAC